MKGIILAGGSGTRLHPMTQVLSKHLLPVYDKPMIYYPLSTLMLAGIRDILLISTLRDLPLYRELLGTGNQWGLQLSYAEQNSPDGIPQAFLIGSKFIANNSCALILGDNIFYGHGLSNLLQQARERKEKTTIFSYYVKDPERYGVVELNSQGEPIKIVEKPKEPKSNYAVTGLYFYDPQVVEITKKLKPSSRGELEITDINNYYLEHRLLHVEKLGRGHTWLDTGTPTSLLQAANFIETVEERQGLKIACVEEIAYRMGFIDKVQMEKLVHFLRKTSYGSYLSLLQKSL